MSSAAQTSNSNYSSIKGDPVAQLELLDKLVKVEMIKNCSFFGFVHSIDPISHSIILTIPDGDTFKSTLIPGHAVVNVTETSSSTDGKPLRRAVQSEETTEDIKSKKSQLMAWFRSNLIPVTESEDKILLGNVAVLSPYNVTDICTDNPIIASQIKQIIEKMPENYEPK